MQLGHRQPPKERGLKNKGSECVVDWHAGEGGLLEIDGDGNSVYPMVGESYIIPAIAIQHGQAGLLIYEIYSLEGSLSKVDALQPRPRYHGRYRFTRG